MSYSFTQRMTNIMLSERSQTHDFKNQAKINRVGA